MKGKWLGGLVARLDRLLGNLLPKAAAPKHLVTKPFHRLASYKGPKASGRRDRHRSIVRINRSNTAAYSRQLEVDRKENQLGQDIV